MNGQPVDVKMGEWIQQGFDVFKDNALVMIVAGLLAGVISGATGGILSGPMLGGLMLVALALVDKKEPKPDIGAVFKGFDFFLNTFLFWLVWCILTLIVIGVLNLIPVLRHILVPVALLVIKTLLVFALFLIVDRKMDFWPASMASINRVKENFFPLLGFVLVVGIIAAAGLLACGVGIFVTAPLGVCCLAVAYRDVFGPAPAGN
jgi:hypothetical protein